MVVQYQLCADWLVDGLPNCRHQALEPFKSGQLYTGDTFAIPEQTLKPEIGWVLLLPDSSRSEWVISKDTSNIVIIVFFAAEAHWAALHFVLSGRKVTCRLFDTGELDRGARCRERALCLYDKNQTLADTGES